MTADHARTANAPNRHLLAREFARSSSRWLCIAGWVLAGATIVVATVALRRYATSWRRPQVTAEAPPSPHCMRSAGSRSLRSRVLRLLRRCSGTSTIKMTLSHVMSAKRCAGTPLAAEPGGGHVDRSTSMASPSRTRGGCDSHQYDRRQMSPRAGLRCRTATAGESPPGLRGSGSGEPAAICGHTGRD